MFREKTYSLGCVVSTCLQIASARPSIVYSRASMFGFEARLSQRIAGDRPNRREPYLAQAMVMVFFQQR